MARGKPNVPEVIVPEPGVPPVDMVAKAEKQKAKGPSPTDRIEARADQHIQELQADKTRLLEAIQELQARTIPELQGEVRWLDRNFARLETEYKSAIDFQWTSTIFIIVGSGTVSYASFVGRLPWGIDSKRFADFGFAALVFGVILQAVNSIRGRRALRRPESPPSRSTPAPPSMSETNPRNRGD